VPGLFAPLRFDKLYPGYDVGLVDGGVFDNQGALALLQEDCSVLIVSDAAGQLGLAKAPDGGHLAPLLRAMDIFQERMRLASFERLRAARENGQLAGLAYVHLKQDLDAGAVDWTDCDDPSRDGDQLRGGVNRNPCTSYGVWKHHQELLAAIRTDLDVFSDIEAAALMASGYLATDAAVSRLTDPRLGGVEALAAIHEPRTWFFSPVIPKLRDAHAALATHLDAGAKQFLRIAALDGTMKAVLIGIGVLLALLIGAVIFLTWDVSVSVGWIATAIAGVVLGWLAKRYAGRVAWAVQLTDPLGALKSQARKWVAVVGTWALARWMVPKITADYLEAGRLSVLDEG
jgi:hypothetical protein